MPSLNETLIAERITAMVSHYWTTDEDPALRRLQALDWLECLKDFPVPIVAMSCRQWVRSETKRPTPADIVQFCREVTAGQSTQRRLPGSNENANYLAERTRLWQDAEDQRNAWARRSGCKDFAEAMKIGIQSAGRRAWIEVS